MGDRRECARCADAQEQCAAAHCQQTAAAVLSRVIKEELIWAESSQSAHVQIEIADNGSIELRDSDPFSLFVDECSRFNVKCSVFGCVSWLANCECSGHAMPWLFIFKNYISAVICRIIAH